MDDYSLNPSQVLNYWPNTTIHDLKKGPKEKKRKKKKTCRNHRQALPKLGSSPAATLLRVQDVRKLSLPYRTTKPLLLQTTGGPRSPGARVIWSAPCLVTAWFRFAMGQLWLLELGRPNCERRDYLLYASSICSCSLSCLSASGSH